MSRLRRSLLFVPGSEERRIDKARAIPADSLIFDLEDAVAPQQKDAARILVCDTLQAGGFKPETIIRVNPPGTPWFAEDLSASVEAGVDAILIPKAADRDDLEDIASGLHDHQTVLLALVETPLGLLAAFDLATASTRVDALCFGHADYCLEMGLADNHSDQPAVLHARAQIAVAAKAAGVAPIDNVCLDIKDEDALKRDIELGIALGYEGKLCIHPTQVEWVNRLYTPSAEQLAQAKRILAVWHEAQAAGQGVIALDGKMIDAPIAAAAERIVARSQS